ncbi:MAG: CPBP family intramembrane glutamic endopeptidase [bacterium]
MSKNSSFSSLLNTQLFFLVLILVTVYPAILTLVALRWQVVHRISYPLGKLIMIGIPIVWWRGSGYQLNEILDLAGLKDKKWWIGFPHGFLIGLPVLALYYLLLQGRVPDVGLIERLSSLGLINIWPLVILMLSIINSAVEEYYWRSFLYPVYTELTNPGAAVIINGFFFTFHHLVIITVYFPMGFALLFALGTGIGGALWADLRRRKVSIVACWISHVIIDLIVMIIGCMSICGLTF